MGADHHIVMKLTTFAVAAALAAPIVQAAPADLRQLVDRQTRPRELIQPELYPVLQRYTRYAVASLATFVYGFGTCKARPLDQNSFAQSTIFYPTLKSLYSKMMPPKSSSSLSLAQVQSKISERTSTSSSCPLILHQAAPAAKSTAVFLTGGAPFKKT